MNRKFTFRETLLLLLCAIVGLGIFYYETVYKNFQESLRRYSVDNIESEVMIYEAQYEKMKQMEAYVTEHRNDKRGEIALYNNLANEISELGSIFSDVNNLSISWSNPTLKDATVRRDASISFSTVGYDNAVSLLRRLNNSVYRILISDLSIGCEGNNVLSDNNTINVSVRVTFYERIDETTNLDGLTILD